MYCMDNNYIIASDEIPLNKGFGMDYEALYRNTQPIEKMLKDKCSLLVRLQKGMSKDLAKGDLKSFIKDMALFSQVYEECGMIRNTLEQEVESFDVRSYFENGDFAEQLLDICNRENVDVVGLFPNYHMFPYKVRVDVENQDLYLDRKKISCVRPESFIQMVKSGREKLMKGSFNVTQFVNELSIAYDMAVLKHGGKQNEPDMYLTTLYKFLVPMSRARKEYDQQSFAFDLARLYTAEPVVTKDGRRYQFGPSRNSSKAIRILDDNDREQFLATIRFYQST